MSPQKNLGVKIRILADRPCASSFVGDQFDKPESPSDSEHRTARPGGFRFGPAPRSCPGLVLSNVSHGGVGAPSSRPVKREFCPGDGFALTTLSTRELFWAYATGALLYIIGTMVAFPVDQLRAAFPSLQQEFIFFDNAAGAQSPHAVLNAVADHLLHRNVQRGGRYRQSQEVDATLPGAGERRPAGQCPAS